MKKFKKGDLVEIPSKTCLNVETWNDDEGYDYNLEFHYYYKKLFGTIIGFSGDMVKVNLYSSKLHFSKASVSKSNIIKCNKSKGV